MNTVPLDALHVSVGQRRNLETLAAYLERDATENEGFSMWDCFTTVETLQAMKPLERGFWASMSTSEAVEYTGACPTVACCLGFGVAAGIEPLPCESWGAYAERCFGSANAINLGLEDEDLMDRSAGMRLWNFLFSSGWVEVDDTREGAAARIRYALDRGLPSADAIEQMHSGYEPPCYRAYLDSGDSIRPREKVDGQLWDHGEYEP